MPRRCRMPRGEGRDASVEHVGQLHAFHRLGDAGLGVTAREAEETRGVTGGSRAPSGDRRSPPHRAGSRRGAWTSSGWRTGSKPSTSTDPPLVSVRPSIIRMVVVLPAPFGPSSPKISPCRISKSMESTARWAAVDLGQPARLDDRVGHLSSVGRSARQRPAAPAAPRR